MELKEYLKPIATEIEIELEGSILNDSNDEEESLSVYDDYTDDFI